MVFTSGVHIFELCIDAGPEATKQRSQDTPRQDATCVGPVNHCGGTGPRESLG